MNPEQHGQIVADYLERNAIVGALLPCDAGGAYDRYEPHRVYATYGWAGKVGAATTITFRIKAAPERAEVQRSVGGFSVTTTVSDPGWGSAWEDVTITRPAMGPIAGTIDVHEPDRFHIRITVIDEEEGGGWFQRRIEVENLRQAGGYVFAIRIRESDVPEFRELRQRGIEVDRYYRGGGLIGTFEAANTAICFIPYALLPEPVRKPVLGPSVDEAVHRGLISEASGELLKSRQINQLMQFQSEAFQVLREVRESGERIHGVLLTAGTGGGKTEAFAFPVFEALAEDIEHPGMRAIFVYPVKALGADQAIRFFEYLALFNASRKHPISIGLFDGDVPFKREDVVEAERNAGRLKSPFSVCPQRGCNGEVRFTLTLDGRSLTVPTCIDCGTTYPWLRFYQQDISDRWPHILLTTPDMLHRRLSGKFSWGYQCWFGRPVHWCSKCGTYKPSSPKTGRGEGKCKCGRNLDAVKSLAPLQVVLDEAHIYKGLFGSQVALLISRLRRIALSNGHYPLFLGASATIAAPDTFGRELFGGTVRVVQGQQQDSNDPPNRYHLFVLPVRVSVLNAIGFVLGGCFTADNAANERNRVLVFSDSKRMVFQLESSLNEFYATLFDSILDRDDGPPPTRSHTGDHPKDERRKIEEAFDARRLRVLLATQTLEVGVDFDALALEVQVGATYSYNDYMQRVGRAGRRGTQALVICVLRPQVPLDYYYFEHCRELIQFSTDTLDDIPLRSDNPFLVGRHAPAAIGDFLIGAKANAELVWHPDQALQVLRDCQDEVMNYLRSVFIVDHSEDTDLLAAEIAASIRRAEAAIGNPNLDGKTIERLSTIIEMSVRAQDASVTIDISNFEQHRGISVSGDLEDDDPDFESDPPEDSDE